MSQLREGIQHEHRYSVDGTGIIPPDPITKSALE
jgi:hypothetical protein